MSTREEVVQRLRLLLDQYRPFLAGETDSANPNVVKTDSGLTIPAKPLNTPIDASRRVIVTPHTSDEIPRYFYANVSAPSDISRELRRYRRQGAPDILDDVVTLPVIIVIVGSTRYDFESSVNIIVLAGQNTFLFTTEEHEVTLHQFNVAIRQYKNLTVTVHNQPWIRDLFIAFPRQEFYSEDIYRLIPTNIFRSVNIEIPILRAWTTNNNRMGFQVEYFSIHPMLYYGRFLTQIIDNQLYNLTFEPSEVSVGTPVKTYVYSSGPVDWVGAFCGGLAWQDVYFRNVFTLCDDLSDLAKRQIAVAPINGWHINAGTYSCVNLGNAVVQLTGLADPFHSTVYTWEVNKTGGGIIADLAFTEKWELESDIYNDVTATQTAAGAGIFVGGAEVVEAGVTSATNGEWTWTITRSVSSSDVARHLSLPPATDEYQGSLTYNEVYVRESSYSHTDSIQYQYVFPFIGPLVQHRFRTVSAQINGTKSDTLTSNFNLTYNSTYNFGSMSYGIQQLESINCNYSDFISFSSNDYSDAYGPWFLNSEWTRLNPPFDDHVVQWAGGFNRQLGITFQYGIATFDEYYTTPPMVSNFSRTSKYIKVLTRDETCALHVKLELDISGSVTSQIRDWITIDGGTAASRIVTGDHPMITIDFSFVDIRAQSFTADPIIGGGPTDRTPSDRGGIFHCGHVQHSLSVLAFIDHNSFQDFIPPALLYQFNAYELFPYFARADDFLRTRTLQANITHNTIYTYFDGSTEIVLNTLNTIAVDNEGVNILPGNQVRFVNVDLKTTEGAIRSNTVDTVSHTLTQTLVPGSFDPFPTLKEIAEWDTDDPDPVLGTSAPHIDLNSFIGEEFYVFLTSPNQHLYEATLLSVGTIDNDEGEVSEMVFQLTVPPLIENLKTRSFICGEDTPTGGRGQFVTKQNVLAGFVAAGDDIRRRMSIKGDKIYLCYWTDDPDSKDEIQYYHELQVVGGNIEFVAERRANINSTVDTGTEYTTKQIQP